MEKGDKGSTLTRMGVSGWMFLLVPAYPVCPGQTAVKWLLLLLLLSVNGMVQEAACLHFKVAVLTLCTFAQMHLIGIWCWNDEVVCCIQCIFWISNLTRPCSSVVKMRWSFCHRYVVSVFWESISERILKIGLQSREWLEIAWCVFIGMRCVYCKVITMLVCGCAWPLDAIVRERRIDQMLSERCDGNRNILHACVAACAPSSNKDLDSGPTSFFFSCHSF